MVRTVVQGAIFQSGGAVEIVGSRLSKNSAAAQGGAIYTSEGTLAIVSSVLFDNHCSIWPLTPGFGGAIYALAATVALQTVTLRSNQAFFGGALYAVKDQSTGHYSIVTLVNVTFAKNKLNSFQCVANIMKSATKKMC